METRDAHVELPVIAPFLFFFLFLVKIRERNRAETKETTVNKLCTQGT